MGDGSLARMTRSEIRADVEDGVAQAVRRAKVEPLTGDEMDHLVDIYASPARFVGVDLGDEIVLSCDGTGMKTHATRTQDMQSYEQWMGADLLELCPADYSLKVIRTILPYEAQRLHDALLCTIAPMQYGIMPNLGLYAKDDGPCDNWSTLLPEGKIAEARAAAEEAAEMAVQDAVRMADVMYEAGADAIDFDTTGASGDPEFWATLRATEIIRKKYPTMGVQLGMAGEFVLGMHGQLEYDGKRLAGMWPLEQLKVVAEGRRDHVRTGREREHRQELRLEHGPGDRHGEALHGRGRDPRPHERGHGRRRACRCSCIRRVTPCAGAPRPASTSCASTACRWVRAIPMGCTTPTRRQRAWAVSGPGEISWPGCK